MGDKTRIPFRVRVTRRQTTLGVVALAVAITGAGLVAQPWRQRGPEASAVTEASLLGAAASGAAWMTYGHDYGNNRYLPLDQVTAANAASLQPVWTHSHLSDWRPWRRRPKAQIDQITTPLMADGVLYYTAPNSIALAVDARTGRELWRYVPELKVPRGFRALPLCCGRTNRGVALLGDKVFLATLDARLLALRTRDGSVVWESRIADPLDGYSETMAPVVADGKVIIGVSGGEFGIRGFVDAYDAETGRRVWRSWTVPSPEQGGWWGKWATTTPDGDRLSRDTARERRDSARFTDAWQVGGGAVWITPAYDPALGLLFVGTGNPSPNLDGPSRPGDNLYTASLLALNVKTGAREWYYQLVPHDMWDYDVATPPVLFDVERDGGTTPAVAVGSKMGWVYVFDRRNGRRLVRSEPLVPQTNIFTAPSDGASVVAPGGYGGTNWSPMAYSPRTGLLYVTALHLPMRFIRSPSPRRPGELFFGGQMRDAEGEKWSVVAAVDPRTGAIRWSRRYPDFYQAGVLVTAGDLVITSQEEIVVGLDARTGAEAWRYAAPSIAQGSFMGYTLDGREYLVTAMRDRIVAFGLPH